MDNAYRLMRKSTGFKIEIEALITAARDQALDTKCHKVKILQKQVIQNAGCAKRRMRQ